ncbi:vomeronasal type-1 receptor 1-like [Petaurus breviceps papuanus]|uniref:vomeronasal type-1 receptor 1-like n=1 Tax=Petaurus breviceps papuanus TaxID=3040969 RepID=UPI0036DF9424
MMFPDLIFGILFLIQMGIGILGNFFLLVLYSYTLLIGHKLKPVEFIFGHLSLANSKVLLFKGIPQMIVSLGIKNFLDHFVCNLFVYLQIVARSVSLSITCILSGFRIITLSPSNSRWAKLKIQTPKYIIPSCFLCWCFFLLINFTLLGIMHNSSYLTNNTKIWHLGYCSILIPASFSATLFAIVFSIPDFMCVGFMIWSSAYLVFLLHRHHKRVKHIHSLHLSARAFPEKRATQAILILMSTYVSFYSINSSLSFYLFNMEKLQPWLVATLDFLAACFPAISPFVLIFCDSQILKYWDALWHRKCCCLLCHTVAPQTPSQHSSRTL